MDRRRFLTAHGESDLAKTRTHLDKARRSSLYEQKKEGLELVFEDVLFALNTYDRPFITASDLCKTGFVSRDQAKETLDNMWRAGRLSKEVIPPNTTAYWRRDTTSKEVEMPLPEYSCPECGNDRALTVSFTRDKVTECPVCGFSQEVNHGALEKARE